MTGRATQVLAGRWRGLQVLLAVVAAKAAIGAAVLAGGFRAVSDDDFARVVLAQKWALEPHFDPTGTSWLPLPFWIYGAVMRLTAPTLEVARATAFVLGLASAAVVYAAARLLLDDRSALVGTMIAAVLPWSARLGVATVPELPAAALTVFAIASLTTPIARVRILGAAALLAACLCRYEPWPVAAVFVALSAWDARRQPRLLIACALGGLGPLAWLAHNAAAHGDPLHFAARVSAYQQALGARPLSALDGYPLALLREEPELSLVALILLAAAWRAGKLPVSLRRAALVCAVALAALALAAIPGGAPTHHAGRAVLFIWIVAALYVGAGARAALRSPARVPFAVLVVFVVPLGVLLFRPWYAHLDAFTARRDETAIGRAIRRHVPPGDRVLLETQDYGYYAIIAASSRPFDVVCDRSLDPRGRIPVSSFDSPEALRRRIEETSATHVVGADGAAATWPPPLACEGSWCLWRLP